MTLADNVAALASRVAQEVKAVRAQLTFGRSLGIGAVTAWPTTAPDGSPLRAGDTYAHTYLGLHHYDGASWRQINTPRYANRTDFDTWVATYSGNLLLPGKRFYALDTAAEYVWDGSTFQQLATTALVGTLRAEAAPPYMPGWSAWNDATYRDLRFFLHRDGWVTLTGLCKYTTGVSGASTQICSLSGNFAPLGGFREIVPVNVNDQTTPRWANIQASGVYLRGTLPSNGQFVAFNARYPGVLSSLV